MDDLKSSFQSVIPINNKLVRRELKSRSQPNENDQIEFENELWIIVYALRPNFVSIGRDPIIKIQDEEFRPDIVAIFDTFILLAEATNTNAKSYIIEELSRIEDYSPKVTRYLSKIEKPYKLLTIMAIKDKNELQESIKQRAQNSKVKILDNRDINYYLTLFKNAGVGIYNLFLCRVSPSILHVSEKKIPAIQIREGRKTKFIFSINPHELLERAFISHRELTSPDEANIGYQRMLNKKKLREIASYVSDNHSFPAPIIVSFPKNAGEDFKPLSKKDNRDMDNVSLGNLSLPNKPASIYVVDGQHRLYGYTLLPRSEDHQINVIAYKGLLPRHQGSMFVDINLKQTKVPSRLLWELYPDILSPEDDEYFKAVISRSLERLIKNDISGLVTHISSGSKGPISFQSLCSEVVRARLLMKKGAGIIAVVAGNSWDAQEERLYIVISSLFEYIKSKNTKWPEVNKKYFLQNTGIIPLIRELGKVCRHINLESPSTLKGSKSKFIDALSPYFDPLYEFYGPSSNQQLDSFTRRVGSSGFITTEDEMDDIIVTTIPTFPLREKRVQCDLRREVETLVKGMQDINRMMHDKSKEWVFNEFDKDKTLKILSKISRDHTNLETFIDTLYQEVVESTTSKPPNNRLLEILGVADISQNPPMQNLKLLRNMSAHRASYLEPTRRKKAVEFLRVLSGDPNVSDFDQLQAERCSAVQLSLTKYIRIELIEKAINKLKEP